ncbi:MAG: hypothetical protein DWC03_02600 [Candidatus Poseidoniales archaeon]|nr:MAG: hypothetical protein DWC03_02600 [Candidatus Poseidoniales archaeon]
MTSARDLDSAQAQEIEEQLFTTHRQQLPRHVPIPLPRQDFWEMVRALLSTLDVDIQEMVRKGSTDMRLQNLQKRQTNIRRIASELARKRMVAMMQHVASQALRSGVNPSMAQELPSLDWQRHDPAEKAFYHALQLNVDRFKKEIDWQGMQQGLLGELRAPPRTHAPGTMQLDAFLGEGQLTSQPPPDLAFEDTLEPLPVAEDDAEERWMDDAPWADEEAYLLADMADREPSKPETSPQTQAPAGAKHGAAMELAPSKEPIDIIEDAAPTSNKAVEAPAAEEDNDGNIRVRILETMPEPIMDSSGEPLSLEAGDVHFLDEATAAWLVDAGVAERAEL